MDSMKEIKINADREEGSTSSQGGTFVTQQSTDHGSGVNDSLVSMRIAFQLNPWPTAHSGTKSTKVPPLLIIISWVI